MTLQSRSDATGPRFTKKIEIALLLSLYFPNVGYQLSDLFLAQF